MILHIVSFVPIFYHLDTTYINLLPLNNSEIYNNMQEFFKRKMQAAFAVCKIPLEFIFRTILHMYSVVLHFLFFFRNFSIYTFSYLPLGFLGYLLLGSFSNFIHISLLSIFLFLVIHRKLCSISNMMYSSFLSGNEDWAVFQKALKAPFTCDIFPSLGLSGISWPLLWTCSIYELKSSQGQECSWKMNVFPIIYYDLVKSGKEQKN